MGQNRLPMPPAMMTAYVLFCSLMVGCAKYLVRIGLGYREFPLPTIAGNCNRGGPAVNRTMPRQ
jgi:hypothetical protein